jgi:hypothetical protein
MKVHITLDGHRNSQDVPVSVSADGDELVFDVPTVNRANACKFSVPITPLISAVEFLRPKAEQPKADAETRNA